MIYALDRILAWLRRRRPESAQPRPIDAEERLRMRMEIALELRKRGRARRQKAAQQAASTRFSQRMEGLRR